MHFITQPLNKSYGYRLLIKIAFKIEDMHFYPLITVRILHSWAHANIHHAPKPFLIDHHLHGIHPNGRNHLEPIGHLYIGRWKSELTPQTISGFYNSAELVGISQILMSQGNISHAEGLSDFGGAY